jgi:hypothetical protein
MNRKFELPFVSRARFDQIWRENVELRQALKLANEERRKLKLIIADQRQRETQP